MDELFKELEDWGCNIQDALFNVMGDREFYQELLRRFLKDPSVDELKMAVSNGDLSAAIQASHEIKGTTATLGLLPLNQEISNFLDAIRNEDVDAIRLQEMYSNVGKQFYTCRTILEKIS